MPCELFLLCHMSQCQTITNNHNGQWRSSIFQKENNLYVQKLSRKANCKTTFFLIVNSLKVKTSCVIFFKITINIVSQLQVKNKLFSTHTHACEFMASKPSWHIKNYGMP